MKIKLIVTDIDGVWTDGGMYYSDNSEFKKFNTSDSVGLLLAKAAGIDVMVVTGEDVECVKRRMEKLKIRDYYPGVSDKLSLLKKLTSERNIDFEEIAFIGDEVNDHPLLRRVGFSGCPQSAPSYTKEIVDYVVSTDGGKGAFRDFVLEVLNREGTAAELLAQISNGTGAPK